MVRRIIVTLTPAVFIGIAGLACDLEHSSEAAPTGVAKSTVPERYELVWSDEFDGKELDMSKWMHRGVGPRKGGVTRPESTSVDGEGHLVIATRKVGDEIHSGMISTQQSMRIKYGYFEARMKFPVHGGKTSAFWLQSPGNSGDSGPPESAGVEIDVVVFYRGRLGGRATNAIHWGGYGEGHETIRNRVIFNDGGDWHTFGVLWTEDGYTFYRDGEKTWETSQAVSHVPEYIILSTAIGRRPRSLERAKLPDRHMIDYVRVYAATDSGAGEKDSP